MSPGRRSRSKGYRGEAQLVKLLKPHMEALRVPLSGGGPLKGDVWVGEGDNKMVLEVKNQEALPDRLWSWLEPVHGLVLKKNNKPYLLVVNLEELLK